ncbi:YbaK/EbsC family protein [Crenobacter sp. SG2303]|uniref:YbaK/EbsC family protein n=1 Tax=Crenobacter oryzisoli TaxID=3056844 RepID=A0ABT7XNZ0_9NEIS|nr:YbaK/EbsC family protein [Crenobacter sp. SG2303]MDN0075398.1 YbaK/EbsC family protein [Crenobacter sp. SG2303]
MAIASTLSDCLNRSGIEYDVAWHPTSQYSMETAELARIPGDRLAKTVLLEDEGGYVAAVLPATRHVMLSTLSRDTGRTLRLACEEELSELFRDCELGAIPPPVAAALSGMTTYVDESLLGQSDLYFEAGDHKELIHLSTESFMKLMAGAERRQFSRHM